MHMVRNARILCMIQCFVQVLCKLGLDPEITRVIPVTRAEEAEAAYSGCAKSVVDTCREMRKQETHSCVIQ